MLSFIYSFNLEILIMVKKKAERRVIKITDAVDKDLDYTRKYRYADMKLDSSKIELCYILLHLEAVSNEYKVGYNDTLMMLYLYELGLFSPLIELNGNNVRIIHLERYGFIEEDYSNKGRKYYSLSAKGVIFVQDFLSRISDNSKLLSKNRKAILDDDSRAKSVLARFFDM